MTGYVLIAFLVIFTGIYFMAYNLNSGYPYFSYVLMNINYVLIIIIPMLTMRSFAEERKNKTDQLLLAAPVKLFDIVMGKYLAMVTVFAVPCLIFCIFPIIIKSFGTAYLKVDYLSISIRLPHLSCMIPCSYWASIWRATLPSCITSYKISVRQTRDLPVS